MLLGMRMPARPPSPRGGRPAPLRSLLFFALLAGCGSSQGGAPDAAPRDAAADANSPADASAEAAPPDATAAADASTDAAPTDAAPTDAASEAGSSAGGPCDIGADGLVQHAVAPADTDPAIDQWLEDHYAVVDPAAPSDGLLYVHLPGSLGVPAHSKDIVRIAARHGMHALGLRYPNSWTVGMLCSGSSDPDCFEHVRQEILTGDDLSPLVDVSPANSIVNRLTKALVYLASTYPSEGWDAYLSGGAVDFRKVVVGGHSQGGGHAAFIGIQYHVARVLMFSSPEDGTAPTPASWLTIDPATPRAAFFGLVHRREPGYNDVRTDWNALGMTSAATPVDVDTTPAPYMDAQSLVTNVMPSSGRTALDFHGSTVTDAKTPIAPDGTPVLCPAWLTMLGP